MASYQAIVDAIDAQILAGVSKPGTLEVDGKKIQFRNLGELTDARKYYARLAARAAGKRGLSFNTFTAGSTR